MVTTLEPIRLKIERLTFDPIWREVYQERDLQEVYAKGWGGGIKDLAESFTQWGYISYLPMVVVSDQMTTDYRVIDGNRRLAALRDMKWDQDVTVLVARSRSEALRLIGPRHRIPFHAKGSSTLALYMEVLLHQGHTVEEMSQSMGLHKTVVSELCVAVQVVREVSAMLDLDLVTPSRWSYNRLRNLLNSSEVGKGLGWKDGWPDPVSRTLDVPTNLLRDADVEFVRWLVDVVYPTQWSSHRSLIDEGKLKQFQEVARHKEAWAHLREHGRLETAYKIMTLPERYGPRDGTCSTCLYWGGRFRDEEPKEVARCETLSKETDTIQMYTVASYGCTWYRSTQTE